MKIIVGLGNPGDKYKHTRHNVGFLALDYFLKDKETIKCESKFRGVICEVHFHNKKTFFVKPKTFMNDSGLAVAEIAKFYKVDTARDILVVHDEIDLPFGTVRPTHSSRSAGHNGVQSIIDTLGNQDFHRLRVGVESRETDSHLPTAEFVLKDFSKEELKELDSKIFLETSKVIQEFIMELPIIK